MGAVLVLELDAVLVVGADDELATGEDVVVVALCRILGIDEYEIAPFGSRRWRGDSQEAHRSPWDRSQ